MVTVYSKVQHVSSRSFHLKPEWGRCSSATFLPPPPLRLRADAALCHLRGESRKALQSGMLKGKHIFQQIWQSQHKFERQRKGAVSNVSLFRLLYVQINSHFVYIEPLGWKKQNTIFRQMKQSSIVSTCPLNSEAQQMHMKTNNINLHYVLLWFTLENWSSPLADDLCCCRFAHLLHVYYVSRKFLFVCLCQSHQWERGCISPLGSKDILAQ